MNSSVGLKCISDLKVENCWWSFWKIQIGSIPRKASFLLLTELIDTIILAVYQDHDFTSKKQVAWRVGNFSRQFDETETMSFESKRVICTIQTFGTYSWLTADMLSFRIDWLHDDVIKWKHFPRHWPRSPVNSPHKGQWRGALMFSLIYVWINDWENNREAGDLRRYRVHYDVIVMEKNIVPITWVLWHERNHVEHINATDNRDHRSKPSVGKAKNDMANAMLRHISQLLDAD